MQDICDDDGSVFDLYHALNCPRGGLVDGRDNENRRLELQFAQTCGLKHISTNRSVILCNSNIEGVYPFDLE